MGARSAGAGVGVIVQAGWVAAALFVAFCAWDVARRALDQRRREKDAARVDDAKLAELAGRVEQVEGRLRAMQVTAVPKRSGPSLAAEFADFPARR